MRKKKIGKEESISLKRSRNGWTTVTTAAAAVE
jgi:cobalamin biosynthesis protein CbiD